MDKDEELNVVPKKRKPLKRRCKACGGTGKSSREFECVPCEGTGWIKRKT